MRDERSRRIWLVTSKRDLFVLTWLKGQAASWLDGAPALKWRPLVRPQNIAYQWPFVADARSHDSAIMKFVPPKYCHDIPGLNTSSKNIMLQAELKSQQV